MYQRTLAMVTGFEGYSKKTRHAEFLEEMEQVVPSEKLCALIDPRHPKAGKRAEREDPRADRDLALQATPGQTIRSRFWAGYR
jgi:hypothetical protein